MSYRYSGSGPPPQGWGGGYPMLHPTNAFGGEEEEEQLSGPPLNQFQQNTPLPQNFGAPFGQFVVVQPPSQQQQHPMYGQQPQQQQQQPVYLAYTSNPQQPYSAYGRRRQQQQQQQQEPYPEYAQRNQPVSVPYTAYGQQQQPPPSDVDQIFEDARRRRYDRGEQIRRETEQRHAELMEMLTLRERDTEAIYMQGRVAALEDVQKSRTANYSVNSAGQQPALLTEQNLAAHQAGPQRHPIATPLQRHPIATPLQGQPQHGNIVGTANYAAVAAGPPQGVASASYRGGPAKKGPTPAEAAGIKTAKPSPIAQPAVQLTWADEMEEIDADLEKKRDQIPLTLPSMHAPTNQQKQQQQKSRERIPTSHQKQAEAPLCRYWQGERNGCANPKCAYRHHWAAGDGKLYRKWKEIEKPRQDDFLSDHKRERDRLAANPRGLQDYIRRHPIGKMPKALTAEQEAALEGGRDPSAWNKFAGDPNKDKQDDEAQAAARAKGSNLPPVIEQKTIFTSKDPRTHRRILVDEADEVHDSPSSNKNEPAQHPVARESPQAQPRESSQALPRVPELPPAAKSRQPTVRDEVDEYGGRTIIFGSPRSLPDLQRHASEW